MVPDVGISFSNIQIWLITITVFLFCYNYFVKESWKRLPPGPLTLPLIGSLPFLGLDVREPLRKMAAKYGDVYTIYLGSRRVIVLNKYDVIKEAFMKNGRMFSGRPDIFYVTEVTKRLGIISSDGPLWQEQRRYSLRILRNFGFGRKMLESRITEEIGFVTKELEKHTNMPLYPRMIIQKSVANVISSVAFGKRWHYDDPAFNEYMIIMNRSFEILGNSSILTVFPFVRFLPGDLFRVKQLARDVGYVKAIYKQYVEEHRMNADKGQEPSDFIYAYLRKMKEEKANGQSTFTDDQLVGVVADLYGAGTETTTTTLTWAILFMTLNEDIQERVHNEIVDVIGTSMLPEMEHRTLLPYTEACLLEVQRLGDVVPLGVLHSVTEDIDFRGYFIPHGTTIMSNLHCVHRDPELWPEPEVFKPERFLDSNGKIVKRDELMPFSIGKRSCLGESLAKMELFLYFTSIFRRFHFRPSPDHPLPDTRGHLTITNAPKPFYVIMEDLYRVNDY